MNFYGIKNCRRALTFFVLGNRKALPCWAVSGVEGVLGMAGVEAAESLVLGGAPDGNTGVTRLLVSSADEGGSAMLLVPLVLLLARFRLKEQTKL